VSEEIQGWSSQAAESWPVFYRSRVSLGHENIVHKPSMLEPSWQQRQGSFSFWEGGLKKLVIRVALSCGELCWGEVCWHPAGCCHVEEQHS